MNQNDLTPLARRMLPLVQWAIDGAATLTIVSPHAVATGARDMLGMRARELHDRLSALGFTVVRSDAGSPPQSKDMVGLFIWLDRAAGVRAAEPSCCDEHADEDGGCEYEDCDQAATVTIADGPHLCAHHALVSIAYGMRQGEVDAALREADRAPEAPPPPPICHHVNCRLKPTVHVLDQTWMCTRHARQLLADMPDNTEAAL